MEEFISKLEITSTNVVVLRLMCPDQIMNEIEDCVTITYEITPRGL